MLETGSGSGAMSLFLSRAGENLAFENSLSQLGFFFFFFAQTFTLIMVLPITFIYGFCGSYYSAHESFAAVHI